MRNQLLLTGFAAALCLYGIADAHAQSPQNSPQRDECCITEVPDRPPDNRPRAQGPTPPRSPARPPSRRTQTGIPQQGPVFDGQMQTSYGACPDPALFSVRFGVFDLAQRETQEVIVSNLADFELGSVHNSTDAFSFEYADIRAGAGRAFCYYSTDSSNLFFNLVSRDSSCRHDAANVWRSVEDGALRCTDSRTACRFTCE